TVDTVAEQLLTAIANQPADEQHEFVLGADTDRQASRLIRPLLACLATKSKVNVFGGQFAFERQGHAGPVWIFGQFENRPSSVRVTLHCSNAPRKHSDALSEQVNSAKSKATATLGNGQANPTESATSLDPTT